MQAQIFTFGPFQENTVVLWDETGEGVVIDPGMYHSEEEKVFSSFIEEKGIKLVALWNTHAHIDHVMGNDYIHRTYDLEPVLHQADLPTFDGSMRAAELYGLSYTEGPRPETFMEDGDVLSFGNSACKVLFTPGHAPGHVVFFFEKYNLVVNGDVLFNGSVGKSGPSGRRCSNLSSIDPRSHVQTSGRNRGALRSWRTNYYWRRKTLESVGLGKTGVECKFHISYFIFHIS